LNSPSGAVRLTLDETLVVLTLLGLVGTGDSGLTLRAGDGFLVRLSGGRLATGSGDSGGLRGSATLLGKHLTATQAERIRVQLHESTEVHQRVLLANRTLDALDGSAHLRLHLIAIDQASDVAVRHDVAGQEVASLGLRLTTNRAVDRVQLVERTTRPHNEATEVTTRCELEEVETGDVRELDTRQVAEALRDLIL